MHRLAVSVRAHTIYTYFYKVTNRGGKEGGNDYYTFKFPTVRAASKRIVPSIARYILFYLFFSPAPLMPTNSLFRYGIMKRSQYGRFTSTALQCHTNTCKCNNAWKTRLLFSVFVFKILERSWRIRIRLIWLNVNAHQLHKKTLFYQF